MTSVLRRKRPTTVRSTTPATPLRTSWFCRAGGAALHLAPIAAALAALAPVHLIHAGNPRHDPAVAQVSYTTSQAGAKLEWLPSRPAKVHRDGQLVPARHSEAVDADKRSAAAKPAAQSDPFTDPFGDGKPRMLPTAQSGQVAAKALGEVVLPNEAVPDFPSEGSAPATNGRVAASAQAPAVNRPADERQIEGVPRSPREKDEEMVPKRAIEDELAAVREDILGRCPEKDEAKPLANITLNPRPKEGTTPRECPLVRTEFSGRCWGPITYTWTASALCHKPLVFEEAQLERYGHSFRPVVQPFVSAAHFFVCVPAIPYILGVEPWNECIYTLGYYRPGSCAPYTLDPLPISIRAALAEASVVTGVAAILP